MAMPTVVRMNVVRDQGRERALYRCWIYLGCDRACWKHATLELLSTDDHDGIDLAGEIERLLFVLQNMAEYTGLPIRITTNNSTYELREGWDTDRENYALSR